MRTAYLLALAIAFAPGLAAQDWTDRAEYDLALEVRAQPTHAARLVLLEQWRQKYPNSPARQLRAELIVASADAAGDSARLLAAARELISYNANDYVGLYWITLLAPGAAATPETLTEAETASKRLLAVSDAFFASPAARPPGADEQAVGLRKTGVLALAHRTLGWVEWKRGSLEAAEREFQASLELAAGSAQTSAWLGSVLAVQKTPAAQVKAVWHLARASYLEGDGALPSAQRRDVRILLEAVYGGYHGALDGLDEIGAASRTNTQAPADFKIESQAALTQRRRDEELERVNPQLLAWVRIKRRLRAPDADTQYLAISSAPLPALKGYVIRCNAPASVTDVILGVSDPLVEEILLRFDSPYPACAEPGTPITFEGTPAGFAKEPFLLTVQTEQQKVQGWPAPPSKHR